MRAGRGGRVWRRSVSRAPPQSYWVPPLSCCSYSASKPAARKPAPVAVSALRRPPTDRPPASAGRRPAAHYCSPSCRPLACTRGTAATAPCAPPRGRARWRTKTGSVSGRRGAAGLFTSTRQKPGGWEACRRPRQPGLFWQAGPPPFFLPASQQATRAAVERAACWRAFCARRGAPRVLAHVSLLGDAAALAHVGFEPLQDHLSAWGAPAGAQRRSKHGRTALAGRAVAL
jgi:hypothetical protein